MTEPNPNTGAVGSTGATAGGAPTVSSGSGSTTPPKHPTQVPNPNATPPSTASKPKAWQETKQGASLNEGYIALRTAAVHTLPGQRDQLQLLAHRPIGG